MKEFIKKMCCLFIFAIVVLSQSCVHDIVGRKMDLVSSMYNPVILNLRNYDLESPDFFRQSEKLVRGHLVQSGGEEWGYFYVTYSYSDVDLFNQAYVITSAHGAFGFAFIPLGIPTASEKFYLTACLYIFDSQGNLIKKYVEKDSFTQVAGLYYGYYPTKRAAKRFSKMYDKIFELAMLQSNEINDELRKAGPITDQNRRDGKEAIDNYFEGKRQEARQNVAPTNTYVPSAPSVPSSQGTSSFNSSSINGGLEVGKFYCVQKPNIKFSISLGVVTIYDGYQAVAMGNATISGRDMIVNFYFGVGSGESLKGQSMTYIIDDSKHFHSAVGNENWTYEGLF